ncbi:hypothetical protein [Mesorhizobium sp. ISC11]|uniref:hypothetical protein n=1 Tax=Mesorhizobium sp. ISC11 TaxID=3076428 RepID=UPI00301B9111
MTDYKNVWEKAKADRAAEDARILAKREELQARRVQSQNDATAWLTDSILPELKAAKEALAGQLVVEFGEIIRHEVHNSVYTSVTFSLNAQRPAYSSPNFMIEVGGPLGDGRLVTVQEKRKGGPDIDTGIRGTIGEQTGRHFVEFLKQQITKAASRKSSEPTIDV